MTLVEERTAARSAVLAGSAISGVSGGSTDAPRAAGGAPAMPVGGDSVSTQRVGAAIRALRLPSRRVTQKLWLQAIARLVLDMRPDIGAQLAAHLEAEPLESVSPLEGMSIGEIGVVYEALLALTGRQSRKSRGQFFTPDDVAAYMASQAARFPRGVWLDPCCGVGNLSWHLARAMDDPAEFVAERLVLIDLDPVALKTATALLVASFARSGDTDALAKLADRSRRRNFLDVAALPAHDFAIVNPPYAATARVARFRAADARDLYAYFLERIATESRGFIAITPASHLGTVKFAELRRVLEELPGGDVLVFDNVPDTCFRGYKYGSTNTSKTNFVRAAITVAAPGDSGWQVTPILRWATRSRPAMWRGARSCLVPLRTGPGGEWAKVMPGTEGVWDALDAPSQRLADLVSPVATEFTLDVASTPRYYVSASTRSLDRGSKHTLYFRNEADRDRAYVVLNSSLAYWWWRCLDGGITLPLRTLLSLPLPDAPAAAVSAAIVAKLEQSEREHVVTKLNAGRLNENVRRPRDLIDQIDEALLSGIDFSFDRVYAPDMFDQVMPAAGS